VVRVESVTQFEHLSGAPEETFALGVALGAVLAPRDFVGLEGPLGAGKTLLARGVAEGAGVAGEDVTSPSYSIVQSYQGRLLLHHADLYRLHSEDELYATGYFDLLESDGAWLVEWVGQVAGAAPLDALLLALAPEGVELRRLRARATGPVSEALLRRWLEAQASAAPLV
jgi:tRNA threonylcarbamoyladenosine biosynthesis protein TsaE